MAHRNTREKLGKYNINLNTTMKKILALFMAAAALTALASCQKEIFENADNESAQTVRIISGAFNNDGTKTTLDTDNVTPLWSVGDKIRVLDGTSYQDVTLVANGSTPGANEGVISADGKSFTFSTSLTGMLYAVYPASATTMTSCSDGNITFAIPAVQDGTFGSANICVASGDGSTANTIFFSNATAVVEMTVKSGVVYANLGAANNIAGNMTVAMGNKGAISTTTPSLSSKSIFVTGTPSGSKFYMAVAPGETGSVTITCNTSTKSGSTGKSSKTLAMNKIYAMDFSSMTIETDSDLTGQKGVQNGQEFVLIKGSDGKYLKWATQNLAVTASGQAKWKTTNYQIGDYFQWAAYDGYVSGTKPENPVLYTSFTNTFTTSGNSFTFKSGKSDGFKKNSNAPYCDGTNYTKYTGTGEGQDGMTVLVQADDVANSVLGGTWRMPTGGNDGEFKAMRAVTYWAWDTTDKGFYVFKPGVGTSGSAGNRGTYGTGDDKTKALLFFPAAGYGSGATISSAGANGRYWSGTLRSGNAGGAYSLYFTSSAVNAGNYYDRYYGNSVRPVSD